MPLLDPQSEAQAIQVAVMGQIQKMFPFKGKKHELYLRNIYMGESGGVDDFRGQKSAKLRGRTWATPVLADLELMDTRSGKVLDSAKKTKLADLPTITHLLSYIVQGKESQVFNQWRLKSGVYTRVKANGELESQFNIASGGPGFHVEFNPESRKYGIRYGDTHVALFPVLQAMGVPQEDVRRTWGSEVLSTNQQVKDPTGELFKLYKAMHKVEPSDTDEAIRGVRNSFHQSTLLPDTTELTLGKALDKVTGEALLLSSRRLLAIARGEEAPDPRDALQFKELWSLESHLPKRLADSTKRITRKVYNNLDRQAKVSKIITTDTFGLPITSFFGTELAEEGSQVNPIEIVSGQRRATIMGPGGIGDEFAVTPEAKLIDPSHLGFLDPIPTPEGPKAGVTTYLPVGTERQGIQPLALAYNLRTGKTERIDPRRASAAVVAFPDQYTWEGGKPKPIGRQVKALNEKGEITQVPSAKVDYVLPSARLLFTFSTNMVPFLANDQGNRANYGSKHISQAISLKYREAPLVQVHTGNKKDPGATWEKLLGGYFSARAPVSGKVTSVGEDYIRIQETAGGVKTVPLYRNYPLNDGHSFLNMTAKIKKGDKVEKGQLLADSNFTQDGTLAVGTNLRCAYLPFRSLTFEDGFVISESAAKKLTSEHMFQDRFYAGRTITMNKGKYRSYFADRLTDEQSKKLDSEGVIQPGEIVQPGDPLVVALRQVEMGREQLIQRGIHKSLVRPYSDVSVRWEKTVPGVVAEVVRHGREIKVHVRAEVPAQSADKLSTRHGGKGVISRILPDEEMPRDADGKPVDIVLPPESVPSRLNPGQIYETLLGKIAVHKGEPYAVTNFESNPDHRIVQVRGHWRTVKDAKGSSKEVWVEPHERTYYHLVKEELERAGVAEKERLFDPTTGEEFRDAKEEPGVLVGHQYFLKLEHMAEKKLSARGQGPGYDYTTNLSPKGGGKHGGQSLGLLGATAMLTHGESAENLREMWTVKSDRSQDDFWTALQAGEMLPPPRPPFVYEKFLSYLNALGVNVHKEGHELQLLPMTNEEILALSQGELTKPTNLVRGKDFKPEKGGLFDEEITGGLNGSGFSHITLPEPVPNPMFEQGIRDLLGITQAQFLGLVSNQMGINEKGKVVPREESAVSGISAVEKLLGGIDVDKDLATAEVEIKTARKSSLDKLNKKIKYLRTLKKIGKSPKEAYLLRHLPVLPPRFRPMGVLDSGDLNVDDLNGLYQQIGIDIEQLRSMPSLLPDDYKNDLRAEIYDAAKALAGLGGKRNSQNKGILDIIAGSAPKAGFFQRQLLYRRQDMTMRGVVTPTEGISLDEVGLPRKAAMEMFGPLVVQNLVRLGYTPLEAREEISKGTSTAQRALDIVASERPVLMKRDPALHKFNVMAFLPKLIPGSTIKVHPLVTSGFGMDFDGNCVIGSSKIMLKFTAPSTALTSLTGVEEQFDMKFRGNTKVLGHLGNSLLVEMEIQDVPYLANTCRQDRNGALIYDVPPGIDVWSYDHVNSTPVLSMVSQLTVEADCQVAQVRTRRKMEVVASDNESLCVYKHSDGSLEKIAPVEAVGRLVPVLRGAPVPANCDSDEFTIGWTIGAFVSDGFFSGENVFGYAKLADSKRDYFAHGVACLASHPVKRNTYRDVPGPGKLGPSAKDHYYVPSSEPILELFRQCYSDEYQTRSPNERAALFKKLPSALPTYSRSRLLGILCGLLDGDGTVSVSRGKSKPQLLFSTSSHSLKETVRSLGQLLGVRISATTLEPTEGRMQVHRAYVLTFSTPDLQRILPELQLVDTEAQALLQQYLGGAPLRNNLDIIPVPTAIMDHCTSVRTCSDSSLLRTLASQKSRSRPNYYVPRSTALRMVPQVSGMAEGDAWVQMVQATDVQWDIVIDVEPMGRETVYDLIVPETKVFAVNGGLIVYDTASIYVPVTNSAVKEAYGMLPSRNLFNDAQDIVMYQPTLGGQLGLHEVTQWGEFRGKTFAGPTGETSLLLAAKNREIPYQEVVLLGGKKTTAGRLLIDSLLPGGMQGGKYLTDPGLSLNKKNLQGLMRELAENHPNQFATVIDKLKDVGFEHIYKTGRTIGLKDLEPLTGVRDKAFSAADKIVAEAQKRGVSGPALNKVRISAYSRAVEVASVEAQKLLTGRRNLIWDMHKAGAKPSWNQVRQMNLTPGLLTDATGKTIPIPVRHSYAEGLDLSEYWTAASGARKGTLDRAQEVIQPGAISKQLANTVMHLVVSEDDCKTTRGIQLPTMSRDILDRYTASPIKLGNRTLAAGSLITPGVMDQLRAHKVKKAHVRSPMRCEASGGICGKCFGIYSDGRTPKIRTNLGVQAGTAVGERSVQLSLSSFHEGGVKGAKAFGAIDRLKQLVQMPQILAWKATVADTGGEVASVNKDPAGGWRVKIGDSSHYVSQDHELAVKKGDQVKKGQALSDGPVDPRELLEKTDISTVQNYLADEMHNLFSAYGIRRRNLEVLVRGLTDLSEVADAGDHPEYLSGDLVPTSKVTGWNQQNVEVRPVKLRPILKGVTTLPLDSSTDWAARMNYRRLKDTLTDGALRGWKSNLHGSHPIPGLMYGAEFGKAPADKPWVY